MFWNFNFSGLDFGSLMGPGGDRFVQTGKLPMSTAVSGTFVRWHDSRYVWCGDDFWRTFQDGPWKWEAQQRYAGKDLNCGHYFALSPEGADAEAKFYGLRTAALEMLNIDAGFDSVLDLTHEENVRAVFEQLLMAPRAIVEEETMAMLKELVDPGRAGNVITDYVGYWASRHGYDGILFFGARAIEPVRHIVAMARDVDPLIGINVLHDHLADWRRRKSFQNLVVLSGANLTTRVSGFRTASSAQRNPYFGASLASLDAMLQYGSPFQDDRSRFTLYPPTLALRSP